jgi:hypothetical protein
MSLLQSSRPRRPSPRRPAARPTLEALEDRCLLDGALRSGIAVFTPGQSDWYVRGSPSPGAPDVPLFPYGAPGWRALAGDWTGSGSAGVGVFDPATATWYLKNSPARGAPDVTPFRYGGANWIPVVGDWEGNGKTTVGVFDPATATWYLKDSNTPGAPDIAPFRYGEPGWIPVVGDWNGDGKTTIGVFDPTTATFYLRNENGAGAPDAGQFAFGAPGWVPVAGDWNGDGITTVGAFDPTGQFGQPPATWYLRNHNSSGAPDIAPFAYGGPNWQPLTVPAATLPGSAGGQSGGGQSSTAPASPQVQLTVPTSVVGPNVTATVSVTPAPASGTAGQVLLDVDLDHNGTFDGPGESGYASGTLDGSGVATIRLHGLAPGTYSLRARVTVGTAALSATASTQVQAVPADHLPMGFEANQGQTNAQVQYLARTRSSTVFLTGTGSAVVSAVGPAPTNLDPSQPPGGATVTGPPRTGSGATPGSGGSGGSGTSQQLFQYNQRMLLGAVNPTAQPVGETLLAGASNYFVGNDPTHWHTGIPNYQGVEYPNIYPGIDVHYSGQGGLLESVFVVHPGASLDAITLVFPDTLSLSIDADGRLVGDTAGGPLVLSAPVISQQINGTTRGIAGGFVVLSPTTVGFQVAGYDPTQALVIDPVLSFGSFLGGSNNENANLNSVTVDGSGNSYVAGYTDSANFPTTVGAVQPSSGGNRDAFVTKIDPTGTTKLFSTYLGGTGNEDAGNNANTAVAVDPNGNVYVAGATSSTDFPTKNPFQSSNAGGVDVFVAELNGSGSALVYSSYLGGSGSDGDRGVGLAVDSGGNAYVTGDTASSNFPTTSGDVQTSLSGTRDAFVTKVTAGGGSKVYSTYLGGGSTTDGKAVAVDGSGHAFVVGATASNNFPTTSGVVQSTFGGGASDAFVTELNPTATGKVYSTYLGGGGDDEALGVAVDGSGNTYVSGQTTGQFPTTGGAFRTTFGGGSRDGFVTKLGPGGTSKVFSSYVGGSGNDFASGIAVDGFGDVYVTGQTGSSNLPTKDPVQSALNGPTDAYVVVLNPAGATELFGTFLGGSGNEVGGGIALDSNNGIYVAGQTQSTDFPATAGVFQTGSGGAADGFIAKFSAVPGIGGGGVNPGPDRFEPNDTSDVATDFGVLSGSEAFPNLSIDRHANGLFDQDWYKWNMSAGGTFTVSLTNISAGGGDIHVRVLRLNADNTLTELGNSTRVGGFSSQQVSVGVNAGDEIYVWVYGFNFALGTYDMAVRLS